MSARTPAPWVAREPNGRGMGWRVGPAWLGFDPSSPQTAADARLIAAAPDLIAIVQTIATLLDKGVPSAMILDENSPTRDAIRDVLAKVAGEAA